MLSKTSHALKTMRWKREESFFFSPNLNDYLSFGKALKKFYHYFSAERVGQNLSDS